MKQKYGLLCIFAVLLLTLFGCAANNEQTPEHENINRNLPTRNTEGIGGNPLRLHADEDHANLHNTPDQNTNYDAIPNDLKETEQEEEAAAPNIPLTINDFVPKWNALSDEYFSGLYIDRIDQVAGHDQGEFLAKLNDNIALRLYTDEKIVEQLQVITYAASNKEQIAIMLASWQQALQIMYPPMNDKDVDILFHEIGIKPNAELSSVEDVDVPFEEMTVRVRKMKNGFSFHINKQTTAETMNDPIDRY